ncbi:MAG: MgtC/SapB family protein [Verrucomicrobia bacterium]|nr:MgtC/SapB family protein [Verrucomicrobiota bacterium]MBV8485386.1 MgtC/SapB family protein [Verrucomicrobiota bacterium]
MPTTLRWNDIALRLALTVIAGALIGLNRGEHGGPAGLRTTMLACLAASVAMIQTNLLIVTVGKTHDSFVVMDIMRLPLGILSGMGFIGAGAIVRRDSMVMGVTTAATLWFVTVIGLCFGGGQNILGLVSLGLGLVILWGLKLVEQHCLQDSKAALTVTADKGKPAEEEILARIRSAGFDVSPQSVAYADSRRTLSYQIRWRGHPDQGIPPSFLAPLSSQAGILGLDWKKMP